MVVVNTMTTMDVDEAHSENIPTAMTTEETWPLGLRIEDYSAGEMAIIRGYMGLLSLLGISANSIVLYLFATTRTLRTPMNSLFISLTVGDFIVSVFASFPAFIYTLMKAKMSYHICIVYGFFAYLGGVANLHALSVIAIERFLTVSRPFNIGALTKARSMSFLGYTWAFAFFLAFVPLIGFSEYVHEGPGFWCSVEWENDSISGDAYIYFIFITSYFFPLTLIIFSYTNVVMKIKEVAKAANSESSVKAQKQVLKQTYVMVTAFIIAWTPYALVSLSAAVYRGHPFSPKVALAPAMFAKSSTIYNPFIYIGLNKQAFVNKILRGKDPFAKKEPKPEADASMYDTTIQNKTEVATVAGGQGNKVAPAP